MAVILPDSSGSGTSFPHEDLTTWLRKIESSIIDLKSRSITVSDLNQLLADCIHQFKDNLEYQNDDRFLKLWIIYLDISKDFEGVVRQLEESNLSPSNSLFYELYALILESKGLLREASRVYNNGIRRNAEPITRLRKAQAAFLDRMSYIVSTTASLPEADGCGTVNCGKDWISPWSTSTKKELSEKINPQLLKYNGYVSSAKPYSGKVALSSLRNSSRNKIIEIGTKKYLIKGCAGQGGFAQVFKAHITTNPDDVVALKIQKPAFPWEFYMYRQLDSRISGPRRSSFGYAHKMHVYADCSILICDFLSHGTLQDAINSFLVTTKSMDEVLCIYYTIEMLYMLEKLHGAGIIHGDFKADNLLMRYTSDDLPVEGFTDPNSSWRNQGLCLVDWGRAIDLHLFPDNAEFIGDCRTSGFRCVEMQENKPWKYQVDIYGFCVVVHMMLHGSYMEIQKKSSSDGSIYQPKTSLRRYWKVDLWRNMFTKLLNIDNGNYDHTLLSSIRHSFEEYMVSNPQLIKKLKDLLIKQRTSLCQA